MAERNELTPKEIRSFFFFKTGSIWKRKSTEESCWSHWAGAHVAASKRLFAASTTCSIYIRQHHRILIYHLQQAHLPTQQTKTPLPKQTIPRQDTAQMASQLVESHRAGAEVHKGNDICKKKTVELLEELGLPKGLFPMDDIEEVGHNCETGFVWIVQKKKKEHTFRKINQTVSYDTEVTAFVEKGKIKEVTGVKIEALSLVEVSVDESSADKVTVKTDTGLSDTHDASAFALWE
ncbi:uncharacterized protein [Triticum aestivum]|nr:uncharacterized protein LOC123121945 [Triticum aestivum]